MPDVDPTRQVGGSHREPGNARLPSPMRDRLALIAWTALAIAAATGAAACGPDDWYRDLVKPHWTPPDAVFAPAWAMYFLMGLAAWLVWRADAKPARARTQALSLFAIQFVLGAAWSPLFFGLRLPGLAFADVAALWLAATLTAFAFARVRPLAGWLLAPGIAWISFALILNGSIWLLNR